MAENHLQPISSISFWALGVMWNYINIIIYHSTCSIWFIIFYHYLTWNSISFNFLPLISIFLGRRSDRILGRGILAQNLPLRSPEPLDSRPSSRGSSHHQVGQRNGFFTQEMVDFLWIYHKLYHDLSSNTGISLGTNGRWYHRDIWWSIYIILYI